jgi:multisubunit Na+/H+ antiporter MnhB subunit
MVTAASRLFALLSRPRRRWLPRRKVRCDWSRNPITAVLMAYRSFDTMLEKVVLVLAVVGVWSLAPDRYWGGAPGAPRATRPESTLAFLAQLLPPLGIIIGIHIVWVGADEPGGAFQGGAILAAMWMITMMAKLTEAPEVSALWLRFPRRRPGHVSGDRTRASLWRADFSPTPPVSPSR